MPTISQLPSASSVDSADLMAVDRAGVTYSLSVGLLLQGTQPKLTLSQGALIGRASAGTGDPEPLNIGTGLVLQSGTLTVDPSLLGGSISSVDASPSTVLAAGSLIARSLAVRAADRLNVLDYGADATGASDSSAAFVAAMSTISVGRAGRLFVPRGSYLLASQVSQPAGRSITVEFDDGAVLTGAGSLAVARVESTQGTFRLSQVGSAFSSFPVDTGDPANIPIDSKTVLNAPTNSGSARVGKQFTYINSNIYSKYVGFDDSAEKGLFSWSLLLDGTCGWGHRETVSGALIDEDTAARGQLAARSRHSEYGLVNNGPDYGWSYRPGVGTPVQGMAIDPSSQSGPFGGHVMYAYGTAGGFDGVVSGINQRWVSYPAVYSTGNPPTVPTASTITLMLDLTAKAVASVSGNGGVSAVTVTAGGGLYASSPTVVLSGGGGSGATASAVMLGGSVVGVTINNPGASYSAAPTVTFVGGGVAAPVPTSITLNPDGAHGDLTSVAAAIRDASLPMISASVTVWGGTVSRLVVYGTAPGDLGALTLSGTALATLGIAAQTYTTPRGNTAVAFGSKSGVTLGDQFTVNGNNVIVGGGGSPADIANAVNLLGLPGLIGDTTADGRLVLTAWLPQQPAGLVLGQSSGATTLGKLGLAPGTILPATPPKAFATALGELGALACATTDAIGISATDLAGNSYGPLTVTLNGGGATGTVIDVAASIEAALRAAGWLSSGLASLTTAPSIVAVSVHNTGVNAGLVLRNTAGGTLTLTNVSGHPLGTLGMVPGTFQPGGYSPGVQTAFHAPPDSLAPQGRGVFVGGSSVSDQTVWPHSPFEVRGSFVHGLRTDRARFGDGVALLLGADQSIGWGAGGPSLTVASGNLVCTSPVSAPTLQLTALPTSSAGLQSGSVWNNGGVLSIV